MPSCDDEEVPFQDISPVGTMQDQTGPMLIGLNPQVELPEIFLAGLPFHPLAWVGGGCNLGHGCLRLLVGCCLWYTFSTFPFESCVCGSLVTFVCTWFSACIIVRITLSHCTCVVCVANGHPLVFE